MQNACLEAIAAGTAAVVVKLKEEGVKLIFFSQKQVVFRKKIH